MHCIIQYINCYIFWWDGPIWTYVPSYSCYSASISWRVILIDLKMVTEVVDGLAVESSICIQLLSVHALENHDFVCGRCCQITSQWVWAMTKCWRESTSVDFSVFSFKSVKGTLDYDLWVYTFPYNLLSFINLWRKMGDRLLYSTIIV